MSSVIRSNSNLAVANPWAMVPPLGNLDAYISAANRLPMLTLEEEQLLRASSKTTTTWKRQGNWCCPTCVWWFRYRAST